MIAFSSSLPRARNALKPPHNRIVSIDGQHSKVLQKPKAMRYAFLPKRTGLSQNISDNCIAHVMRLPSQGCRHRAQRVHGSQCGRYSNHHSAALKHTKSRLTHGKESQCARRLNDWTARKGGLGRINKGNAVKYTTFPVIFFIVQISRPANTGTIL